MPDFSEFDRERREKDLQAGKSSVTHAQRDVVRFQTEAQTLRGLLNATSPPSVASTEDVDRVRTALLKAGGLHHGCGISVTHRGIEA